MCFLYQKIYGFKQINTCSSNCMINNGSSIEVRFFIILYFVFFADNAKLVQRMYKRKLNVTLMYHDCQNYPIWYRFWTSLLTICILCSKCVNLLMPGNIMNSQTPFIVILWWEVDECI